MRKRLAIILPLLFAMLSFKVSASVLVLVGGGYSSPETRFIQEKERGIHHWSDSEQVSFFEEFIEEEEEEEEDDSDFSKSYEFSAFSLSQNGFSSSRQVKSRKLERKLFMLYHSYKIDCCKF